MARYGKKAKKKNKSRSKPITIITESGEQKPGIMVEGPEKNSGGPIYDPAKYGGGISEAKRTGRKQGITEDDMKSMGFDGGEIKMMEDMAAIKSLSPFMSICRCTKTFSFAKGGEKIHNQHLHKGSVYVMALGMYDTLRWSPQLRKDVLKPYKHNFAQVFNRYEGQNLDGKTILIWRTGGIGDLLFIKPNIEYIKRTWPTAKVWMACAPSYQNMVKHWDDVDRLVDLPIDYYTTFAKADYHVTFEGAIERNNQAHELNAYDMFSQWMGLDLEGEDLVPHQDPPAELVPKVENILKKWAINPNGKEFILLQMQPSSPIRAIRQEKWIEVIDELTERGHEVVITDSPVKSGMVQGVISKCQRQKQIKNFAEHSETLDWTIALASMSKGTIGPDSSLCHIAGSLGVPTFGIFGPFTGEIRLKHFPKADWINCEMDCTPCFLHGNDLCKVAQEAGLDHSPCLTQFEAKDVVDRLEALID